MSPTPVSSSSEPSRPSEPAQSGDRAVKPGHLYIVATPIGNLGDLTPRARAVLSQVDRIAAEDTRHTGQLLQACGIKATLVSMHEHNEVQRSQELLGILQGGGTVALVSDAGTPLISDPGFCLLREAARAGIIVHAVPGACAAVAALSIAALPTDRFSFEGFLPVRSGPRRERLSAVANAPHTLIFYEAPHRLRETLVDMAAVFGGDRNAVVARELTKMFETVYRGPLTKLAEAASTDNDMQRGEIVILVAGAQASSAEAGDAELQRVLTVLLKEVPVATAATLAAQLTGAKRNRAYSLALQLSQSSAESKD